MGKNTIIRRIIVVLGIVAIVLFWFWFITSNFPVLKGDKVNPSFSTYYKSIRGYYYISVGYHRFELFNHGLFSYLDHVDSHSFIVLAEDWAKDKNHVWHCNQIVEGADAASFLIDKTGLPKDKNHVYVPGDVYEYKPTDCGINVETAEYFVFKHDGQDWSWMRDKDNVYFHEVRVDVDRDTFRPLGSSCWWIDKDWIYYDQWDSKLKRSALVRIDSLQVPLDTLSQSYQYLRNGRNVIYLGKVIIKDSDITQFEDMGFDSCRINDMLYIHGERIQK